jgi:hypothetical protein
MALLLAPPLALLAVPAAAAPPSIDWAYKSDNVYARAAWRRDNPPHHIIYLGQLPSAEACGAACLRRGPECHSFTYNGFDSSVPSFTSQCFMVTDSWWRPTADANTTSGRLAWCPTFRAKSTCPAAFCTWRNAGCVEPPPPDPPQPPAPPPALCKPCTNDAGCSFNGRCLVGGRCACDAAWRGGCCETLAFESAVRGAGLHSVEADGHNTSSWGGSVLRDEKTGTYHMWAAEMVRHCGINAWTENSRIVHATSSTAGGKYTRRGQVFGVFSHEPNAVRDPDTGEWVLFFTAHIPAGASPAPHKPECNCTDGSTVHQCGGTGVEGGTFVSWASSPDGPWTPPLHLFTADARQSDTNLAPVILPGGKLVGIWRIWLKGSWPHLVTASNYKDPASYNWGNTTPSRTSPLFPGLGSAGTEDPALYLDKQGRFHALFHNMQPGGNRPATNLGHAYSRTGTSWTYTGVCGNSSGTYTDGTTFAFSRRERPHPVFAEDGTTIVAVTNGVQYKDSTTKGGDAVFTFLQPIKNN